MLKIKTVIIILKILANFIVHRNFDNLIYNFVQKDDTLNVEQLRKYEKTRKKIRKAELDLIFLMNCQTLNVVPKFLSFNLPKFNKYDKRCIRKRLLRSAVSKRKKKMRSLKRSLSTYEKEIQSILSSVDKFILDRAVEKNIERSTKTHQKKITNLTKNIALPFTHNETIHNLSAITLTTEELDKTDVLTTFEFILKTMTKHEKQSGELKAKLLNLANTYVNNYRPSKYAMKKHRILKRLCKNNNIVILQADKGDGTVILDRDVYIKKILEIIKDRTKFKELSTDPTIIREGQLQRFLRSMKDKNIFTKENYEKIYPSGSKLAFIYGTPKIHKLKHNNINELSPRPIISSIGTYNYNLAKFLSSLLEPVISTTHCTKDSFSFCEKIKKVRASNKFLVSYVCSLFTSFPLTETIDIAVDLLFEKNMGFKISKADLKNLFQFATSGTHFMFEGKFYDQIDDVAIGSPLGPPCSCESFYGLS